MVLSDYCNRTSRKKPARHNYEFDLEMEMSMQYDIHVLNDLQHYVNDSLMKFAESKNLRVPPNFDEFIKLEAHDTRGFFGDLNLSFGPLGDVKLLEVHATSCRQ
jgi:hypothetical protein